LTPAGLLTVVVQRPTATGGTVSETGYTSLKILEPVITLVAPESLGGLAGRYGFLEVRSKNVALESGKSFFVGAYRLEESRA